MKYCNMKMSNNPAMYEIINKQYLRSIRNISEKTYKVRNFMNYCAIQANPTQWMVALLAAVNHLNGPLKEQKLPSISSKSHIYRLWLVDFTLINAELLSLTHCMWDSCKQIQSYALALKLLFLTHLRFLAPLVKFLHNKLYFMIWFFVIVGLHSLRTLYSCAEPAFLWLVDLWLLHMFTYMVTP